MSPGRMLAIAGLLCTAINAICTCVVVRAEEGKFSNHNSSGATTHQLTHLPLVFIFPGDGLEDQGEVILLGLEKQGPSQDEGEQIHHKDTIPYLGLGRGKLHSTFRH